MVGASQVHLTVILGQKEHQAIIAVLVANTPGFMQSFGKILCLLCFRSTILQLHTLDKRDSNLQCSHPAQSSEEMQHHAYEGLARRRDKLSNNLDLISSCVRRQVGAVCRPVRGLGRCNFVYAALDDILTIPREDPVRIAYPTWLSFSATRGNVGGWIREVLRRPLLS